MITTAVHLYMAQIATANRMNQYTKNAISLLALLVILPLISGCTGDASNSTPDDQIVSNSEASNPDEARADTDDPQEDELPSMDEVERNQEPTDETEPEPEPEVQTINIPATWKRLSDKHEIWIDLKSKEVIAAGHICMQAGPLEVFACPRHTKEHEAVISVNALSSEIHAGLLAIGETPGKPVQWQDEYQPATGPVIDIEIMWKTEDDELFKRKAQQMVRNTKTGNPMDSNWVFGGSQEFTDEESGETFYYGDGGELVCLSNFSTATLDVPVQSSDANEGLLFEANTPMIPTVATKVYVVFRPAEKSQDK